MDSQTSASEDKAPVDSTETKTKTKLKCKFRLTVQITCKRLGNTHNQNFTKRNQCALSIEPKKSRLHFRTFAVVNGTVFFSFRKRGQPR